MPKMNNEECSAFKAMSDATRLKILLMIREDRLTSSEILKSLRVSQPTLSYHMKTLIQAHLVDIKKVGRNVYYSLNKRSIQRLLNFFEKLGQDSDVETVGQ